MKIFTDLYICIHASRFENSYIPRCTTKMNRKKREIGKNEMNTSNAHKSFNSFLKPTKGLQKEQQNPPKKERKKENL